jgi:hypothetical protein
MEHRWNDTDSGSTRRDMRPSLTPFTRNPTPTGLELNSGFRSEGTAPATSVMVWSHLAITISISQRGVPQNFNGAYARNRGINT